MRGKTEDERKRESEENEESREINIKIRDKK